MNRADWLAERRTGIGSSDVAAILGLDPFRTPIDVWLSKTHPEYVDEQAEKSLAVRLGTKLEPLVAELYAEATGRSLDYREGWIFRHPKFPELICTPDRLAKGERRVIEIKAEIYKDCFGDAGTDQVPDNYLAQVAHQLSVLDFNAADVALLHLPPRLGIYPVARDQELEQTIIDRCREFWHNYVLTRKEPPIDHSPTWSSYIAQKFPQEKGEIVTVTDPHTLILIQNLLEVRVEIAEKEKLETTIQNELKGFIGENAGLTFPRGKITWKRSKDTTADVTDWRACFEELSERIESSRVGEIIERHTQQGVITRKGSRKFIVSAKEGK